MTLPSVRRARHGNLVFAGAFAASLAAAALGGCAPSADEHGWTPAIRQAPAVVRQAYSFAHDHPEATQHIPCYCGCGSIGHTSNYDCFISGEDSDGNPIYDEHALGCSICVDIALDAERLLADGDSLDQIRAYIDMTYSPYGPSNMP